MLKKLKHLGEYDPKNLDKTNSKKETLISAEKISEITSLVVI